MKPKLARLPPISETDYDTAFEAVFESMSDIDEDVLQAAEAPLDDFDAIVSAADTDEDLMFGPKKTQSEKLQESIETVSDRSGTNIKQKGSKKENTSTKKKDKKSSNKESDCTAVAKEGKKTGKSCEKKTKVGKKSKAAGDAPESGKQRDMKTKKLSAAEVSDARDSEAGKGAGDGGATQSKCDDNKENKDPKKKKQQQQQQAESSDSEAEHVPQQKLKKQVKKKKKEKQRIKTIESSDEEEATDLRSSDKKKKEKDLKKKRQQKVDSSLGSGTWVQCCVPTCYKWRYLPDVLDPSELCSYWVCEMNPDEDYSSCKAPEQSYNESEHIFSSFTLGSIVWARLAGYPWWPAMVDEDPDYATYFECRKKREPNVVTHYNVVFLDEPVTRAWIPIKSIKSFTAGPAPQQNLSKLNEFRAALSKSEQLAQQALQHPIMDRLKKYSFVNLYKGRIKKKKGGSPYTGPILGTLQASQGSSQSAMEEALMSLEEYFTDDSPYEFIASESDQEKSKKSNKKNNIAERKTTKAASKASRKQRAGEKKKTSKDNKENEQKGLGNGKKIPSFKKPRPSTKGGALHADDCAEKTSQRSVAAHSGTEQASQRSARDNGIEQASQRSADSQDSNKSGQQWEAGIPGLKRKPKFGVPVVKKRAASDDEDGADDEQAAKKLKTETTVESTVETSNSSEEEEEKLTQREYDVYHPVKKTVTVKACVGPRGKKKKDSEPSKKKKKDSQAGGKKKDALGKEKKKAGGKQEKVKAEKQQATEAAKGGDGSAQAAPESNAPMKKKPTFSKPKKKPSTAVDTSPEAKTAPAKEDETPSKIDTTPSKVDSEEDEMSVKIQEREASEKIMIDSQEINQIEPSSVANDDSDFDFEE